MWGVGIMYIILGSLYFILKKVNPHYGYTAQRIHLSLFITGIVVLLISIFSFLMSKQIYYAACGVSVCIMSLYVLRMINRWMVAIETMMKLSK